MNEFFHLVHLRREQAREAYPLVRIHAPAVTLRQWQGFAGRWIRLPRHRGGLVAVRDMRGYIHALFSYRITSDLCRRRLMRVSDLIVGQLPGKAIHAAIVTVIERLAEGFGCSLVIIELLHTQQRNDFATRAAILRAGYASSAISFLRAGTAELATSCRACARPSRP